MVTYFKAVKPDGTDFATGKIDYASAVGTDQVVKHPSPIRRSTDAVSYLSISVSSGDCTGFRWSIASPARLFEVKPVGRPWTPHASSMPNKRAVAGVRVIRELPGYLVFGPQGEAIVEILRTFLTLDPTQRGQMYSLRTSDWWEGWSVVDGGRAGRAGLRAARNALYGRLGGFLDGDSAYCAALAVLLRHTIGDDGFTQAHYDALTKPWVTVTGTKAHPEDVIF